MNVHSQVLLVPKGIQKYDILLINNLHNYIDVHTHHKHFFYKFQLECHLPLLIDCD
jgi:hypothetical protein